MIILMIAVYAVVKHVGLVVKEDNNDNEGDYYCFWCSRCVTPTCHIFRTITLLSKRMLQQDLPKIAEVKFYSL